MVFAVQLYELTPGTATQSLSLFALQARGHWFEPSCAHRSKQQKTVPYLRKRGVAPSFALRLATAVRPGMVTAPIRAWQRPAALILLPESGTACCAVAVGGGPHSGNVRQFQVQGAGYML